MAVKTTLYSSGHKRRRGISTSGTISVHCKNKPVTGMNEGCTTAGDVVFKLETRRLSREARRIKDNAERKAYLDASHEYLLRRGDDVFGAPKTMTGREALQLNRTYEKKFMNDKSPTARLWRWYVNTGRPQLRKGTTLAEYRRAKFESSLSSP